MNILFLGPFLAWMSADVGNREIVWRHEHKHSIWFMAFSSDGKRLLTSAADRTVKWWDLPELTVRRTFDFGKSRPSFLALISAEEAILSVQGKEPRFAFEVMVADVAKGEKNFIA